jgi:lysyl-tRNA synthetase class 2
MPAFLAGCPIEVNVPKNPPFWSAGAYAARRPYLLARARIAAALRVWFTKRDFVEVETAALQVSPGNETHLHAFATDLIGPDGKRRPLYLHTSPEFACKKLLAAGETRVVDFARVFRNRERGALHHPEFTMLEWYRANETYEALMDDCAEILAETARAADTRQFRFRDKTVDPYAAPERLTVADAFARYAGVDLLATVNKSRGERAALAAEAIKAGVAIAQDDTWGDVFSRILAERVDPHLGIDRATILYDYPLPLAALARPKPGTTRSPTFRAYAGSSWRTPLVNSRTSPNNAHASRLRWRKSNASIASAIRWMRTLWTHWDECLTPVELPSGSIGW